MFTAPENTNLAFVDSRRADGYEADVAVSWDGVPFLIHDVSLKRTTDIDEVGFFTLSITSRFNNVKKQGLTRFISTVYMNEQCLSESNMDILSS